MGRERAKEELEGWNDTTQESFGVVETHRVSTQITDVWFLLPFHGRMYIRNQYMSSTTFVLTNEFFQVFA